MRVRAVAAAQAEGKRVSWAATTAGICATDLLVVAVYDDKRVGLRSPREESIFTGSCRELASGSTSVQLEGEKPRPFIDYPRRSSLRSTHHHPVSFIRNPSTSAQIFIFGYLQAVPSIDVGVQARVGPADLSRTAHPLPIVLHMRGVVRYRKAAGNLYAQYA